MPTFDVQKKNSTPRIATFSRAHVHRSFHSPIFSFLLAKEENIPRDREPTNEDCPAVASPVAAEPKRPGRRIPKLITAASPLHWLANGKFAAETSPPSRTPYQYSSLNEDLKEIRLLTLHEGDFKADIHISIHTIPLTSENPPIYEALSYVWGSPENPINIQVGIGTLAVTRNLAEALPYLRYKDRPRTLWIDAICVNQKDLKERSLQVKRMADLYRLADRVVAWLGPGNKHSTFGLRLLEDLSSKIKVDRLHQRMEPASVDVDQHWSDKNVKPPYGKKELLAIREVIKRPWFKRLWVQQEIRLAGHDAILICGFDFIAWKSFRQAIFCLDAKGWAADHTSFFSEDPNTLVNELLNFTEDRSTFVLMEIMRQTNHCKYSDPRDRVYAILSLLNKSDKAVGIEPDYEKTTSQVYQDVALRYITHHKKVNILLSSWLKDKPSEMPTWTPDWTVANAALPFHIAEASGFSQSKVQYRGAGVLSVTGTHSATVQHAERMKYKDKVSLIAEIQRLAPDDVLRSSYVGGGSLLAAYCDTICANHFGDTYLPLREDWAQFQQSGDFLSAILQPARKRIPDYSRGTEAYKFLGSVWGYCEKRSFIKTREGYIGLAPRTAQPGDQVCVLLGCNMPLLLRPTANLQYQIVGDCYIHGLMHGEAFLGRLPYHYEVITKFDARKRNYYRGFLNHQTGKTQYNDPRHGSPLENGGEEEEDPIGILPNGSRERFLTAEMLEKRGVNLQSFALI